MSRYGPWEQLRITRNLKGINQTKLSNVSGVSRPHITNLEAGVRWPNEEMTAKLAAALDVLPEMIARKEPTGRRRKRGPHQAAVATPAQPKAQGAAR